VHGLIERATSKRETPVAASPLLVATIAMTRGGPSAPRSGRRRQRKTTSMFALPLRCRRRPPRYPSPDPRHGDNLSQQRIDTVAPALPRRHTTATRTSCRAPHDPINSTTVNNLADGALEASPRQCLTRYPSIWCVMLVLRGRERQLADGSGVTPLGNARYPRFTPRSRRFSAAEGASSAFAYTGPTVVYHAPLTVFEHQQSSRSAAIPRTRFPLLNTNATSPKNDPVAPRYTMRGWPDC